MLSKYTPTDCFGDFAHWERVAYFVSALYV